MARSDTEARSGLEAASDSAAPALIDLAAGHPESAALPVDLFRAAAAAVFARDRSSILNYGAERGEGASRRALATFLAAEHGVEVDPERLFVTAGASVGLDLLCTLFTSPGDTVVVAAPTYHLALRTFADHGLEVVEVEGDREGIDARALRSALAAGPAKLLYLVPSFANPSGVTMSPERRLDVLEVARAHGTTVVADDVYALLAFDGATPAPLGWGREGVVNLGSFSKILAPGARVGWIHAQPDVLDAIEASGLVQGGGGLNPIPAALVAEVLASGAMPAHLRALRSTYADRARGLVAALERTLPDVRFLAPTGGYFVWARFPGRDARSLLARAHGLGVAFQPGDRFTLGDRWREYARLSFSRYPASVLAEGVSRLRRAVD
jgi:2-aminoadipate transaminase